MRLRTFIAANMADAMDAVRRELGADAIIVSSFASESGGIEVTAAIESGASRPLSMAEVENALEQRLRDRLRLAPSPASDAPEQPSHSGIAFDETLIAHALDAQGIPVGLRDALVSAATALGSDDAVSALASALEARIGFEPIPTRPNVPIMLVGLPGSGKTVTCAKLAAAAVIEGVVVDLITTDTARAGAAAQSSAYGQLLDLTVRSAENVDTLSLLLEENAGPENGNRSARPCFIDTASVNPFDRAEFTSLKRFTEGARIAANAEPVLVLSATGDAQLLGETVSQFAALGVRRLVATQVDISRRLGGVLAAADKAQIALAQISVTPYLARGLAPMNSLVCARLILGPHAERAEAKSLASMS